MKKIKLYFLIAAALFTGSTMAQTVTTGTYSKRTINDLGNTSTWEFNDLYSGSNNLNVTGADEDIYYNPSSSGKIKLVKDGKGLSCSGSSSIYLPVPSGSEGTVTMNCYSNSDGRQFDLYVEGVISSKNLPSSKTASSFSFVSTDITTLDGKTYLLLKDNSAEMKVSSFSITLTTGLYAIPCTDAGLLLPENPNIEANEGAALTAPVLTNPNNVAVTYSSSDESVVIVAADGSLTNVGAGDAVITITSASQTINEVSYCADELTYNVKIKSTTPVLVATESALDFSLNAFETTKSATFTVSGYNLSDDASISISELPAGFTLDPATLTITDGAVEQTYTLTYAPEAAVEASNADLVFTVGTTSVTIALTYGKKETLMQTTVTADINWVWTNAGTEDVLFTETSIPSKTDTIVLANVEGIVNDANFNSQALSVCGEYMYRKEFNCFQGGYISFEVEKAGSVTVSYSHTSKAKPKRSLVVNGQKDAASTADYTPVTSTMSVNAGKVVITFVETDDANNAPQYARVYSVSYTVDNSGDVGSAVEEAQVEAKAVKVIRNGQLLIIREGKTYTAQGMELR